MNAIGKKIIEGKPRLLIILNRFVIGGPAVDTIPLAWYLKKDFEILILHGEKEKNEVEPLFLLQKYPGLRLKKIKYLSTNFNPFFDIYAFFHVLIILVKFRAHIVHTHGAKSGFTGRFAAWILRVPVIIHTYHGHFFHSYFSKKGSAFIAFAERAACKVTTSAIALSQSQKDELVNKYRILPASKIAVISLGFDFDNNKHPEEFGQHFRKKYNLQKEDIAIGIIGRIVNVKNHSFFVKIIHRILSECNTNPPAFFIIGDGDLRISLEKELHQKNILFSNEAISSQTRVIFTSWLTDINEVMNGLDIVVLTSLNEGTPLSIIEAQFFKKPVVATDAGGVKDSLEDGVTGFLIEKNDIAAFCEKLSLLANDKALRKTMGEAGNKFVSAAFSKQKEVTKIKELYYYLLNKNGYYLR